MIEVSISAVKGGFRELHKTTNAPPEISRDIRADSGSAYAVGQVAYAISFLNKGLVFTKCKIIRDVLGGSRVGNIAISIFLPFSEKLSGEEIKTLLDELMDYYSREYIDRDNNLGEVYENWSFVDVILSPYKTRPNPNSKDAKEYQLGTADAAFVYYTTNEELQKYFDSPLQPEYKEGNYREIYFVENVSRGTDKNPLNALRHNSLSQLKIDLENEEYTLHFNENSDGLKIEVLVNNIKRNNNSKIRQKDELEIKFSKPYHIDLPVICKLESIDSKYLDVNKSARKVHIKEQKLVPMQVEVKFEVKDKEGYTYNNTEIICKSNGYQPKNVNNNKFTFNGEELKAKWTASVIKDKLLAQPVTFTPESQIGDVLLNLEEYKTVKIIATDDINDKPIYNFKIQINGTKKQPIDNKIEFVGDEINKPWRMSITHNDCETMHLPEFNPSNTVNDEVKVQLKKRTREKQKTYSVEAGKHGKFSNSNNYFSNHRSGDDLSRDIIIANKGWEFIGYELKLDKKNDLDGTIIAQYKKKIPLFLKPVFISAVIVMFIITSIGLYLFVSSSKSDPPNSTAAHPQEVTQYIEGTKLDLDTLNKYQKSYCGKTENPPMKTDKSFWQKIFPFGSNEVKSNEALTTYDCPKIDSAISIRLAINLGRINELKNKQYSEAQENFKRAVNNIDVNFIGEIGEVMKKYKLKISSMDLNEVANFISNIQELLKIRERAELMNEKDDWEIIKKDIEKLKFPVDPTFENIKKEIASKIQIEKTKNDTKSAIKTALEKDIGKTETKEDEKTLSHGKTQKQINNLKNDFWGLVNNGVVKKDSYDDLLKKYKSQGGEIIDYLNRICKNSKSFDNFKRKPELDRKNAKTISDLEKD